MLHENTVSEDILYRKSDIVLANFSVGVCLDVCAEWINVHY